MYVQRPYILNTSLRQRSTASLRWNTASEPLANVLATVKSFHIQRHLELSRTCLGMADDVLVATLYGQFSHVKYM